MSANYQKDRKLQATPQTRVVFLHHQSRRQFDWLEDLKHHRGTLRLIRQAVNKGRQTGPEWLSAGDRAARSTKILERRGVACNASPGVGTSIYRPGL